MVEVSPADDHAEITSLLANRVALDLAGDVIVCELGVCFRPNTSLCSVGGTPRPELPTMTPLSVGSVERGAGGDVVVDA